MSSTMECPMAMALENGQPFAPKEPASDFAPSVDAPNCLMASISRYVVLCWLPARRGARGSGMCG
jgi:hypothetical protein